MRVKDRPSACYVCGCKIYHDIEPGEWMRGARYFECGNHFVFGNPPKPNGWANGCFYLTGTFNQQRTRIAALEAALRAMVEGDCEDSEGYCRGCGLIINHHPDSKHAPDCPWVKAKEALGNG